MVRRNETNETIRGKYRCGTDEMNMKQKILNLYIDWEVRMGNRREEYETEILNLYTN